MSNIKCDSRAKAIDKAVTIIQELCHEDYSIDKYGKFYDPQFELSKSSTPRVIQDEEKDKGVMWSIRMTFKNFTIRNPEQMSNLMELLESHGKKYDLYIKQDKPLYVTVSFYDEEN